MNKIWLVRLEVARDDNGAVSDEGVAALTKLLDVAPAKPILSRGESGSIFVELTVDGNDEQAARSTAQGLLRESANTVWRDLGLSPFTISVVEVTQTSN
jgi:hypothetical protein